jgi:multidrug efflux pump subunit AcrA (membrane-fusion protein)
VSRRWLWLGSSLLIAGALASLAVLRLSRAASVGGAPRVSTVPATRVKRGTVTLTVSARGELQGGSSEMLAAPTIGGNDMGITFLREPGELVHPGDEVVRLDTTEQEFKLREAEADLAEAQQHIVQAQADAEASEEEDRYQLQAAADRVKLAELDVRRNPLLAAIVARQNELVLEAMREHQRQLQQDAGNRKSTAAAGIAIQEAARSKARVQSETARRNIAAMTLRATITGYVNVQQNATGPLFQGMNVPPFQLGDTVRAGVAVVQIPDLRNWEVVSTASELDRGHLAAGQKVDFSVIALPGKKFTGRVKVVGGTTGPAWDRHFELRVAVDNPAPELRPGMSTRLVITEEVLPNVLWIPSQALFEANGRAFVYLDTPSGFVTHDVTLVRRSESQAVVTGIGEGELVAMSNPDQQNKPSGGPGGAMKALAK